jgi:hypothetical protein
MAGNGRGIRLRVGEHVSAVSYPASSGRANVKYTGYPELLPKKTVGMALSIAPSAKILVLFRTECNLFIDQ